MQKYICKIDDISSNKTKHLIVTIVKNTAIDIYRKKKKNYTIHIDEIENIIESEAQPLDDLIINTAEAKELSEKLSKLKIEYAEILTLKYYHQFSDSEIADILNIEAGNVRIRLHRAKNALKKLMSEER